MRLLAITARWDNHLDLFGCEEFSQRVGIIAFVGDDSIKTERCQQRFGLGEVMAFPAGQDELQGEAMRIDEEVDLAAEATPAPTQALFVLAPPFLEPPAAHIWARTAVLSGMTSAISGSWANCLNMSAQMPFSSQRA